MQTHYHTSRHYALSIQLSNCLVTKFPESISFTGRRSVQIIQVMLEAYGYAKYSGICVFM